MDYKIHDFESILKKNISENLRWDIFLHNLIRAT